MINVRRLGHATLSTPDLDRQVDYYLRHVGLSLVHKDEVRAVLATRVGQETIVLERGTAGALTGLAFQVPPGTDLAELQRQLQAASVRSELRSSPTPGIDQMLVLEDPKGTKIEIFSDYRFQGFDKSTQGVMPLKLGHVAFRVTNLQAILRFYIDLLGFRISDSRDDTFYFLRCSPDHHTVNFLADDKTELHHFAFELKDWGEIHRGCEVLARDDIHQVWGPGRHIIGHNIACYHHNADKLMVEFYTEMDQMKDETLGYFEPRPWHQDFPQWPKVWGPETLRNYWGFGSERPAR
ncbi:MAG TPA: VOC family protein [Stellaceae bacterium]|nr:VOC family protein [Stellaceae bacterium]